MDARVVVFGSANLDVTLVVDRVPAAGETVLTPVPPTRVAGGKGLNQAVAAARTGVAPVTFVADEFLAGRLTDAGVHPMLRMDPRRATGMALILLEQGGENRIVVASGANLALDEVTAAEARELGGAAVVLMPGETPLSGLVEAARAARAGGALVVLNAAPVPDQVADLAPFVDVLVVNESEALGVHRALSPDEPAPADVATAAEALTGRFGVVVVTVGDRGVLWARFDEPAQHVPAFAVPVVDTTGAGDTFCGAFAAALAVGADLADAVERGVAASALAVQRPGASSSVPERHEVDALLASRR